MVAIENTAQEGFFCGTGLSVTCWLARAVKGVDTIVSSREHVLLSCHNMYGCSAGEAEQLEGPVMFFLRRWILLTQTCTIILRKNFKTSARKGKKKKILPDIGFFHMGGCVLWNIFCYSIWFVNLEPDLVKILRSKGRLTLISTDLWNRPLADTNLSVRLYLVSVKSLLQ